MQEEDELWEVTVGDGIEDENQTWRNMVRSQGDFGTVLKVYFGKRI